MAAQPVRAHSPTNPSTFSFAHVLQDGCLRFFMSGTSEVSNVDYLLLHALSINPPGSLNGKSKEWYHTPPNRLRGGLL